MKNTNTTEKVKIAKTASELVDMFEKLADIASTEKDSNANKRTTLYNRVASHLLAFHESTVLEYELTPRGAINVGTVGEVMVKAAADCEQIGYYGKSPCGVDDVIIGKKHYEIKTGISCYSTPTACKPDKNGKYRAVIFLNENGVWLINADDVPKYLDKNGKLAYNGIYTRHYKKIEKYFGLWE